ncbi:unnamed protein product [Protopolystoma xenopodis]|uniref:ETS domain-containing protein n=1 Tax=Protopolystoma xenopodis TaxID=117903 RepID=A0A448WQ88_9PLAT|nr:unnamed protein product [Protopolystoma xenopodis]
MGDCFLFLSSHLSSTSGHSHRLHPLALQTAVVDVNGGKVTLWQFLLELLLSQRHSHLIRWTNTEGEFVLLQAEEVAKLWGLRKDKNHRMNYDKLSRALRYYYQKNIIRKVHGHKFVYQFTGLRNLAGLIEAQNAGLEPGTGYETRSQAQLASTASMPLTVGRQSEAGLVGGALFPPAAYEASASYASPSASANQLSEPPTTIGYGSGQLHSDASTTVASLAVPGPVAIMVAEGRDAANRSEVGGGDGSLRIGHREADVDGHSYGFIRPGPLEDQADLLTDCFQAMETHPMPGQQIQAGLESQSPSAGVPASMQASMHLPFNFEDSRMCKQVRKNA